MIHTHIQFGHCYKGQEGWADYLDRFVRGDGLLYDIEFLTDDSGRRVAAFGYYAGYAGAAVALLAWAHQVRKPGTPCPSIPAYPSEKTLVSNVKWAVKAAVLLNNGQQPQVHIIGALGRCGRGAIDLCNQVGIADSDVIEWDIAETRRGGMMLQSKIMFSKIELILYSGPFAEIAEADVFVNCVYLTEPIRPFVTRESLSRSRSARKLRVVCDVSCDLTDPKNPVPLYTTPTTFTNPTSPVNGLLDDGPELTIIAIDHLPSLVAREASDVFSKQLLPSLKSLDRRGEGVWLRAEKMFREHVSTIPQNT